MLEKEDKWAKELAERDAVVKEVAEKKMEVKFIDADIQTKRNIIKALEEKEASFKDGQAIPVDQQVERLQKQNSYFENEVRKLEGKIAQQKSLYEN